MNWLLKSILGATALAIGGGDLTFAPDGYEAVSPGVVLFLGVLLLLTGWGDRQTDRSEPTTNGLAERRRGSEA